MTARRFCHACGSARSDAGPCPHCDQACVSNCRLCRLAGDAAKEGVGPGSEWFREHTRP